MDYKKKYLKYKQKYDDILGGRYDCINPNANLLNKICKENKDGKYEDNITCLTKCLKNKKKTLKGEIIQYLKRNNLDTMTKIELKEYIIKGLIHFLGYGKYKTDKDELYKYEIRDKLLIPMENIFSNGKNYIILNSVFSRLGDLQIELKQKKINNDIDYIFSIFTGILFFVSKLYKNSLPTIYDSFIIDTKVHYMDILLNNNLCDSETIILYYNLKNHSEYIEKRSIKTIENIKKIFDNPKNYKERSFEERINELLEILYYGNIYFKKTNTPSHWDMDKFEDWKQNYIATTNLEKRLVDILEIEYEKNKINNFEEILKKYKIDKYENETRNLFLKFPFSGSSRCGFKIKMKRDIDISNLYNILLQKYDNLYTYTSGYKYMRCLGIYYGLILQPENDNFSKTKEVRCICYKGDIKVIILNNKRGNSFFQKVIKSSIFKPKLKGLKNNLKKIICEYIIDTNEWLYTNKDEVYHDFDLLKTNIIHYAKKTYNVLKQNLKLESDCHRIDFVQSREEKNKYVVNEVENINFGGYVNNPDAFKINYKYLNFLFDLHDGSMNIVDLLKYSNLYDRNKKILEDELKNNLEEDIYLKLYDEINDFFIFNSGMRELMLSFNY
jgi:hypothetical protein